MKIYTVPDQIYQRLLESYDCRWRFSSTAVKCRNLIVTRFNDPDQAVFVPDSAKFPWAKRPSFSAMRLAREVGRGSMEIMRTINAKG